MAALSSSGACLLEAGGGCRGESVLLKEVFGERLRAVAGPEEAGCEASHLGYGAATGGHAFGDLFPDCCCLLAGGGSGSSNGHFLVDGYAVLDELAQDIETAWVPSVLETRVVDQTSRLPSVAPVVLRAPCGRRALRCFHGGTVAQRPAADSDDWEADEAMLSAFHAAVERASARAPRIVLRPGEALLVDNYRMFHGRDSCSSGELPLQRYCGWTDKARSTPDKEVLALVGQEEASARAGRGPESRPPGRLEESYFCGGGKGRCWWDGLARLAGVVATRPAARQPE